MDIMNLMKMGAQIFIESNRSGAAGSRLDIGELTSVLSSMAGATGGKSVDLGSVLSAMESGGLGAIANSWLGDGVNDPISPSQVIEMFGSDKISEFASRLGLSNEEAAGGLSEALPQIVDKASSDGSLFESFGGVSGAINLAGKLFGK